MATSGKVGRNERCPCGSGKKYKACCGLKERDSRGLSTLQWVITAAVVAAVTLLLISVFTSGGGDTANRTCPPGQSWSTSHGHCH